MPLLWSRPVANNLYTDKELFEKIRSVNLDHDPKSNASLTRIVADDLDKRQVESLSEFLTSRLPTTQVVQRGSVIEFEAQRPREVKLLLHKFLHSNALNEYRISSHEAVLEIVHLKPEEMKMERPESLNPSMPGPIAGIPHTVKPSDMVEWSSHPWERRSSSKKK